MIQKILIPVLVLLNIYLVDGQNAYPQDDFIPPVDFTMALSGTFAELRSDHFHSGIDIKTQGVEGKKLKSIADGFVSRVAVSAGGFGRALYIDHPNGYTSVYGHCKNFSPEIEAYVKKEQYNVESFEINLFPEPGQFIFKQGDIIAYSGNTGGSFGPHLHFEVRKTNDQVPVNPLLFGFPVKDYIRPSIVRLLVYPYGNFSFIDGENKTSEFKLSGWGPKYQIQGKDTIQLSGEFYFGIETYDKLNDSGNKNGVYEIEVFIDSNRVYHHRMEQFNFSESRYVNSLIDYAYYSKNRQRVQKTRIEPNNQLSVYQAAVNNGVFQFFDDQVHLVRYIVKDAYANESILTFYVQSAPPTFYNSIANGKHKNDENIFSYDCDNFFECENVKFEIPKGSLYDTLSFKYQCLEPENGCMSKIHAIHNETTPIHNYGKLSIKPLSIDSALKDKVLIVRIGDKKDTYESMGGDWEGAYLTTKIRNTGNYTILIDTTPPAITPVNVFPGKDIATQTTIKFTIKDELAGISSYRATMNDKWILMEWDPKNDLLKYNIDDRTLSGTNQLKLVVTDSRNNESVYEATLVR